MRNCNLIRYPFGHKKWAELKHAIGIWLFNDAERQKKLRNFHIDVMSYYLNIRDYIN